MMKLSMPEAGQMMKEAAANLRALSGELQAANAERDELKTKVASYERKERAEKIAHLMEQKGINTGLSFQEKVAGILNHPKIDVLEEAVGLDAPQVKTAFVHEDERALTGSDLEGEMASTNFAASLMSYE